MSERKILLARARELGLNLPGNISTENLKKAIAEKQAGQTDRDLEPVNAVVLDQLKHDGKAYGPDDPVQLTQQQFDRLEFLGVVAAAEAD